EPVGIHVIHVYVYRRPPYVSEEAVVQALSPYGRARMITYATFQWTTAASDAFATGTGRRDTPVRPGRPHAVTGVAPSATLPLAARYPPCGVSAATRTPQPHSCPETPRPSPAASAAVEGDPLPADCPDEDPDPSVLRRVPPPPAINSAPGSSEEAVSQDDPVSNISTAAAATFSSPTTNSDDLSSNSDRLVTADEDDVTPGYGQSPSTPSHRELLSTCSSPTGLASADKSAEDMLCDRPDFKLGVPSTSSGSDAPHT
ncbi:hypothetical protein HPB47_006956, partial [Ixodes persulcatus]